MSKKAFTAAKVILGLTGVFAISFIAVVVYSIKAFEHAANTSHIKQIVAEDIQITTEWTEITPKQSLEPTNQFQELHLSVISVHKYYINMRGGLENTDFSERIKINPEIEIIDANGRTYKSAKPSKSNNLIKFSLYEKPQDLVSIPKGIKYKTFRIRSDTPFKCRKVIWYDYTLK